MPDQEQVVVYLDVHKRWKDEARDFTPWLAANLDMLGEAIGGVKLQRDHTEARVGAFACDILATAVGTGVKVAIENQLEWSDHSHLGQLLTYAAGLGAGIAVWVTPAFRYEHAEALHRLNQWTRNGIQFYGVRVTLQKTGSAAAEPYLQPVVTPCRWDQAVTQPKGAMSPLDQQYQDFYEPLVARLIEAGFAEKAIHKYSSSDRFFPSFIDPDVGYAVTLESTRYAWAGLHIQTKDKKLTKYVFDELEKEKEDIEATIDLAPGREWHWYRQPRYTFSSINIRKPGTIYDPREKLDETINWMLDMLPKFKEVFDPRVQNILNGAAGR